MFKRSYSSDYLLGILILLYTSSSFLTICSNLVYFIPRNPFTLSLYWDITSNISLIIANIFLLAISIKILNTDNIRIITREWILLFLLFYLGSNTIILLRNVWFRDFYYITILRDLTLAFRILIGVIFLSRLFTQKKLINRNILVILAVYLVVYSVSTGNAIISVFNNEGLLSYGVYILGLSFIIVAFSAVIVMYKVFRPSLDMQQRWVTLSIKMLFLFVSLYYIIISVLGIIDTALWSRSGAYSVIPFFLANSVVHLLFGFIILIYPEKITKAREIIYSIT